MGPIIANLAGSLNMPTGCGEQNMITLIPSIFVAKYLKSLNRYTQDIAKRVAKYTGVGENLKLSQSQHYRQELHVRMAKTQISICICTV